MSTKRRQIGILEAVELFRWAANQLDGITNGASDDITNEAVESWIDATDQLANALEAHGLDGIRYRGTTYLIRPDFDGETPDSTPSNVGGRIVIGYRVLDLDGIGRETRN